MRITQYVAGAAKVLDVDYLSDTTVIEVELLDCRTVQLVVRSNGEIDLRGWGTTPAAVGNSNQVGFHCKLDRESPTTCTVCYSRLDKCGCIGSEGSAGCNDSQGGLPNGLPGETRAN